MILVISDTHCYYSIINRQIEYAEKELGISVSSVIHLGDFGIFSTNLHDFFIKKKERFLRPVFFIEGNHEDYDGFNRLMKRYNNTYFTHLPRSSVRTIGGYRFLSLGGSAYMDAMNTQKGSIITDAHIDSCLAVPAEDVDIILTHDCPKGIGVPNTPGLEYFGETGFPRSRELADHFRPKLWLFGHHHKWHEYSDEHTRYYGLGGSWKGFGLLDKDFTFRLVQHTVPWEKTPLVERILMKLRIIRPDRPPDEEQPKEKKAL